MTALEHCRFGHSNEFLRQMSHASHVLNRLRIEAGLTYAQVDALAKAACGKRWCDFTTLEHYDAATRAVAACIP